MVLKKSKNFSQMYNAWNYVRHGKDAIVITFGHDDLEELQPMKGELIADVEVVLSPLSAQMLAETLLKHLGDMGAVPSK